MTRFTFTLSCFMLLCACGGGGDDDENDGSNVQASGNNAAPHIAGTPVTLIWDGDAYVFDPIATDPDNDPLTFEIVNRPPWASFDSATGRLQGTPSAADVGTFSAVRIRVTDGEYDSWLNAFDITVEPVSHGSITLTWTPPSQNTDNSMLQDLSGFNIYWGPEPGELPYRTNVVGGGISSHLIDDLSPGRYYFATTALNSLGIESALSDLAVVVVR